MMKLTLALTLLVILAATAQAGKKNKGGLKAEKGGKKCKADLKAATEALTEAEAAKAAAENAQAAAEAAAENAQVAAEEALAECNGKLENAENTLEKLQSRLTKDCKGLLNLGKTEDGVYTINPSGSAEIEVYCDMTNGGWTVIQRRVDASVDFYRGWDDYVAGFGDPSGNFWAGLDNIHALTSCASTQLVVNMATFEGQSAEARYSSFKVDGPGSGYKLTVSGYSGNAGDAMTYHNGMKFTTKDRDQDAQSYNCAERFTGAFWYQSCHHTNPNGIYESTEYGKGINWNQLKGFKISMKTIELKVKGSCV